MGEGDVREPSGTAAQEEDESPRRWPAVVALAIAALATYPILFDDDLSQGSLGEATCALGNSLTQIANLRAYAPELVGWFDGFAYSGQEDASGGLGTIAVTLNAFSPSTSGLVDLLDPLDTSVGDLLQGANLDSLDVGNLARCPGSLERDPGDGSTAFTDGGALRCDPSLGPTGP